MIRIGHGYDVHKFSETPKPLILGGVEVDPLYGVEAHSDGDVVIHAICDALLGALALRDIGYHFPDTDEKNKNKDSTYFLSEIIKLLNEKNYKINNLDVTVILQKPKLAPFIESMRARLACVMQINLEQINVKATTTEKLGFVGRKEGIAVHSVCLIENI